MTDGHEDPALGELEDDGKLTVDMVLYYSVVLGGGWRQKRLSELHQAIADSTNAGE